MVGSYDGLWLWDSGDGLAVVGYWRCDAVVMLAEVGIGAEK
jgi:hypothetical protein